MYKVKKSYWVELSHNHPPLHCLSLKKKSYWVELFHRHPRLHHRSLKKKSYCVELFHNHQRLHHLSLKKKSYYVELFHQHPRLQHLNLRNKKRSLIAELSQKVETWVNCQESYYCQEHQNRKQAGSVFCLSQAIYNIKLTYKPHLLYQFRKVWQRKSKFLLKFQKCENFGKEREKTLKIICQDLNKLSVQFVTESDRNWKSVQTNRTRNKIWMKWPVVI